MNICVGVWVCGCVGANDLGVFLFSFVIKKEGEAKRVMCLGGHNGPRGDGTGCRQLHFSVSGIMRDHRSKKNFSVNKSKLFFEGIIL